MTDELKTQIILSEIDRQWIQAKQSEDQRSTMSNFMIVAALAAQGFIVDKDFPKRSLIIAISVCLLGLLGMIACSKYYERFRQCAARVGRLREELDAMDPSLGLDFSEKKASIVHKNKHKIMSKIPLNKIWIVLMLGIFSLGLYDILIIIKFGH